MQVNNNTPSFGAKIKIDAGKNTKSPFLYNEILRISKAYNVTTVFNTKNVKIDIPHDFEKATSSISKALINAGINFDRIG